MDSDLSKRNRSDSDFEVTGISRSGRVRKKSSKLMDFESPDDIESRPRKIITIPRQQNISQVLHKNIVHEPDPDSDVDVQNDTKSEGEEMEGGTSDSDYYDPSMDNQDSMDSMDSDDMGLSDSEINFNSSNEQRGRSITRPGNSLYFTERSHKKKTPILDNKDKSKVQRRDKSGGSKNSSPYFYSPTQQRSSSRNRHSNAKSSTSNALCSSLGEGFPSGPSAMYVEVGAHLRLLGESLTIIGERLKEHEGQIAVSGSVSVLLDTLLCSLVPLICLTVHVPSIAPPLSILRSTLDNIAYIMPGL